ncbi:MAG: AmmeMemoRadiSam system protein B [Patescibacteria group bacterium]|nr:AmmeMemoRadiSam system protein B [Patescibacteria group bacterium]
MSFIFAGISPHPPALIPNIGKDKLNQLEKTKSALEEMEGDLYVLQPDTIFIISPHSPVSPESFSLNLASEFESGFDEFNDQETKCTMQCDLQLVSKIKEAADFSDSEIPVTIYTQPKLDHGVCVPLHYLSQHLPEIKIVPISVSNLSNEQHLEFGRILKNVALESNKRVAFIASADLAHNKQPDGQSYDVVLQKLLKERDIKGIVKMNPDLIGNAKQCGYQSILILLGALQDSNFDTKIYSYEAPLGVGYLVADFTLK